MMVTGCAPFFLLGLAGVALGSWLFGSHYMARITGLGLLTIFLTYFALLNWTSQTNLKNRRKDIPPKSDDSSEFHAEWEDKIPFTEEDRREWNQYLRTEGRILWFVVTLLVIVLVTLFIRK